MAKAAEGKLAAEARARATEISTRVDGPVAPSTRVDGVELSQTLRQYIAQANLQMQFEAATAEQRRSELQKCRNAGLVVSIMQGYWLAEIKAREGGNAFRQACSELNISRAAAYYSVGHYQLFNHFDDLDVVQALGSIEPSKFRALRFEGEEWGAFARGDAVRGITIDQVVELSVDGLLNQQRDWEIQNKSALKALAQEKLAAEIECQKLKIEVERLTSRAAFVAPDLDIPIFERAVRDESFVLTEEMRVAVAGLDAVAANHLFSKQSKPADSARQPVAAGNMYFRLAAVIAQATRLLKRLEETFPDVCEGGMRLDYQFSEAEIEHHEQLGQQMFARARRTAEVREIDRANQEPGKRGRKRHGGSR